MTDITGGLPLSLGALFLVLAALLLIWSSRMRRTSGLPSGRLMLSDTDPEQRGQPLYSARYGLAGTPDYLVDTRQGPVPVEVKPGRTDAEPHESHLLQVLAYCLLVEESHSKRPPYGLLRYSDESFKVDYNRQTRAYLLEVLKQMREAETARQAHRDHQAPSRCRACGYRSVCEESLWPER